MNEKYSTFVLTFTYDCRNAVSVFIEQVHLRILRTIVMRLNALITSILINNSIKENEKKGCLHLESLVSSGFERK